MPLGPLEDARVWNSLDPVLKEKVRKGEMTIDEAATYVVPIGDLEQSRAREAGPNSLTARPEAQIDTSVQQPVGLDGQPVSRTPGLPSSYQDNESGRALFRGMTQAEQGVDVLQMGAGLEAANQADLAAKVKSGESLPFPLSTFAKIMDPQFYKDNTEGFRENPLGPIKDAFSQDMASTLLAAGNSEQNLTGARDTAQGIADVNVEEMNALAAQLAALPPNPAAAGFIEEVNKGNYVDALTKHGAAAAYYATLEQVPTLGLQAGVTATTAMVTRSPRATAAAGRAASFLGGASEIASDYQSLLDEMSPEDKENPQKKLEAFRLATKAAGVRGAVEALTPGTGLGKTLTSKIATMTAAQMASEASGEWAAGKVLGQERSAGELALEALASGPLSAVAEGGGVLRSEAAVAAQKQADALTARTDMGRLQRDADARVKEFIQGNNDQVIADANREKFDAEIEADRAIEAYKLQNATQGELPFGSDMTADPQANDRTPVIQDMFSGETTAATKIQQELDAKAKREELGVAPPETDESFEVRTQREAAARDQIDQRKQGDFELKTQEESRRRRQLEEDKIILKNERMYQSPTQIKQEAKNRIENEKNLIRKDPANRRGARNARLGETLEAYERKRLPELINEVKQEWLTRIVDARERVINEENRQVDLEDIETENEFGRMQDERRATEAKANAPVPTDLFDNVPQQELLPPTQQPTKPAFTGTLTEKQAQLELAAGQLNRQKLTEKIAPARKAEAAKLDAAQKNELTQSIEAEIPTVEAALKKQLDKKASLTAKTYAKSEKDARDSIIEDELTKNPNRPAPEIVKAVAERVATWRKSNPRPSNVPAPVNEDPLVQKAKEVAKAKETAQKTKETKDTKAELKREIEKGATPEEAAEIVRNRKLTPAEDAKLRSELGTKKSEDMEGDNVFLGEDHPKEAIVNSNKKAAAANPTLYNQMKAELTSDAPSIVNMLNLIINDGSVPEFQRLLARRLLPSVRGLKIRLMPSLQGMAAGGTYRPSNNTIYMNSLTPELVLHEALHGVLSGVLRTPYEVVGMGARVAKLKSDLEDLRLQTIDSFNDGVITRTGQVPNELGTKLAAGNGPLSNVDELVSYFMTNPDLQYLLDQAKATPGWIEKVQAFAKAFYNAVARFVGISSKPEVTALQQLSDSVSELLGVVEQQPEQVRRITERNVAAANLRGDLIDVDTTNFQNWFRDSKVVDESGEPMVVYTGTSKDKDFASFNAPGNGIWFTSNPAVASDYALNNDSRASKMVPKPGRPWNIEEVNTASRVIPVYLSIQNPYTLTPADFDAMNKDNYRKAQKALFDNLKRQGYDGVNLGNGNWVAFEAIQIKSAIGNNGNFSTVDKNILKGDEVELGAGFTNPVTRRSLTQIGKGKYSVTIKPEWTESFGSFLGTLIDSLTAGGGRSAATTEIFERAQSSTAAMIRRAEQLFAKIDYNLERQAIDSKMDMKGLRDEYTTDVKAFEKATGKLEKLKLAADMKKKYGDAARAYFQMRRTMDNLSRDILRQRLEDPRPFTEAEAKIYRSIKDNIGSYYTRVYAANTKGVGEERARKMWDEYTKMAKGDMNVEYKDGYDIVRKAAEFVRDSLLTIPSQEKLEAMNLLKLQKLADAWGVEVLTGAELDSPLQAAARKEQLITALLEYADVTPEAKEMRAIQLVEDTLFAREKAVITDYYRGSKQDRTIVTEREAVPEPIRKLMGEYEDMPLRAMITIARQAEFRARNKAFSELIKEESGSRILTSDEYKAQGLSPRDWTLMKGASYGALEGMYVRTDLATAVEDSAEVARTFDQVLAMAENKPLETVGFLGSKALALWSKAAGMVKSVQLVWNLGNMAFNFGGGGAILLSNGNLNIKQTIRAFKTARDLIDGAALAGGKHTADTEKVVRAGITDSAFMGEIRAVELEQLRQQTMEFLKSPLEKRASGVITRGSRLKRGWKEAYAMADVVWKIANFFAEEQQLTDYYKANGDKVSAEFIEREAARRTNVSNFSYKRVPKLFKVAEKAGLTYILPYIYETFRAPVGSFIIGAEDIRNAKNAKTPKARNLMLRNGSKRLLGSFMAMGIAQQLAYGLAKELSGLDDEDEEWLETVKAFLPDYKEYSDYLPMGTAEDGTPVLFEFSRLDPMGPATEFYKMMLSGAGPDEYLEAVRKLVIENPYGTSILQGVLGTGSTNTRLENLHPALYDTLVRTGDAVGDAFGADAAKGKYVAKVVDSMLPSWYVRAFDPKNRTAKDDLGGQMFKAAGMSLQSVDVAESLEFAANQYNAERSELKEQALDFLKTRFEPTDEDILRRFVELRDKEDKAFERIEKVFEGAVRLGYTPEMVAAKLKEDGISDNDIRHLANGGYRPEASNLLSLEGLERSWGEVVQDDSTLRPKKQKYLDNINRALRLAGEGRLPMGE